MFIHRLIRKCTHIYIHMNFSLFDHDMAGYRPGAAGAPCGSPGGMPRQSCGRGTWLVAAGGLSTNTTGAERIFKETNMIAEYNMYIYICVY